MHKISPGICTLKKPILAATLMVALTACTPKNKGIEWNDPRSLVWANECMERGEYDNAIEHYHMAMESGDWYVNTYNNLGAAYYMRGEYDRAIQYLNEVYEVDIRHGPALNNLGYALMQKGDFQGAIEFFSMAIMANNRYTNAHNGRGVSYLETGDFERAIADFNEAIKMGPGYAACYVNRGMAYQEMGDNELAARDFERAIELGGGGGKEVSVSYYIEGNAAQELQDYSLESGVTWRVPVPGGMATYQNHPDYYDYNYDRAFEIIPGHKDPGALLEKTPGPGTGAAESK
jgi:tetratricopeptide (TPR) repeat protein